MSLGSTEGRASFNVGDLLVLVCAVMYAGQIVDARDATRRRCDAIAS